MLNWRPTLVFAVALIAAAPALAETGLGSGTPLSNSTSRGRLPDGRAFRVDTAGYQLVDQIAELEVTVDELRSQVGALENELDSKEGAIGKLSRGVAPVPTAAKQADCSAQVAPLTNQIELLRGERTKEAEALRASSTDLGGRVALLEKALADKDSKLADRDEKIAKLSGELGQTKDELGEAIAKLSDISDAKIQLAKSRAASEEKEIARASLQRETVKGVSSQETPKPIKISSDMAARLKSMQSLIMKRKDLLDQVRSTKKGISVEIQPLNTKSGQSLDKIRLEASKATTPDAVAQVSRGLAEINTILEEDIALLARLSRGR